MSVKINIDDLVGVRYHDKGRDTIGGFDCYGLAIEVSKRFGHTLPDIKEVKEKQIDYLECAKKIESITNLKRIESVEKESDILLIKNNGDVFNHIGVYLGDNMFIHCDIRGVHIDRLSLYKNRIWRIYKWL